MTQNSNPKKEETRRRKVAGHFEYDQQIRWREYETAYL